MKETAAVEFRVLHYQTAFLRLEKNLCFKRLTLTTNLERKKRKQVKSINRDTMHLSVLFYFDGTKTQKRERLNRNRVVTLSNTSYDVQDE